MRIIKLAVATGVLLFISYADNLVYIGPNAKGYSEYQNKKDGMLLVEIPEGKFWMGSTGKEGTDAEHPQHELYLNHYYISKYELTNEQFDKFVRATGYKTDAEKTNKTSWRSLYTKETAKYPVVRISYNDAKAYCDWAGLRLPTEAEWEKAARGIDKRRYPWGNDVPGANGVARCNYADNNTNYQWSELNVNDGYKNTAPVGSYDKGISYYGCYDMAGNVWEICADYYDELYYMRSPKENPQGSEQGVTRVIRGGSWYTNAFDLRCASRAKVAQGYSNADLGFRPVYSK
jgi:formylglycine-generating enzyme required for sulfatase activity